MGNSIGISIKKRSQLQCIKNNTLSPKWELCAPAGTFTPGTFVPSTFSLMICTPGSVAPSPSTFAPGICAFH